MAKVLVLCHLAYGDIERTAVAEDVRRAGAKAATKRIPELMSEAIARGPAEGSARRRRRAERASPSAPARGMAVTTQMENVLDQSGAQGSTSSRIRNRETF